MAKTKKATTVLWTPERRAAFSRAQKARWAAKKRTEGARESSVIAGTHEGKTSAPAEERYQVRVLVLEDGHIVLGEFTIAHWGDLMPLLFEHCGGRVVHEVLIRPL